MHMHMGDCIGEGVVLLIQRDKTYRPFILKKGRKLRFEKVNFYPDGALGQKFGSYFKVEKQQLRLFKPTNRELAPSVDGTECGSDNRKLFDDGKAQELTEDDVKAMRGSGMSGQGIISSMIEHSSSFKDKTKYSQEKYIKKKERKYMPIFRIIRTTTQLLCDMYFTQTPTKTYYLRKDTLAQILTLSNAHANTNMMVMETCQGFFTGAMLERMGGYGKLVQVFYGDFPVRVILDNFGHLSASDKSILMAYPIRRAGSLLSPEEAERVGGVSARLASASVAKSEVPGADSLSGCRTRELPGSEPPRKRAKVELEEASSANEEGVSEPLEGGRAETLSGPIVEGEAGGAGGHSGACPPPSNESGEAKADSGELQSKERTSERESQVEATNKREEASKVCSEAEAVVEEDMMDDKDITPSLLQDDKLESEQDSKKKDKRTLREEGYARSGELLSQRKMDGLVIVCRHHPEPILMTLLHFLAPSRPFVVYCHLLEPLVQCYKALKESNTVFSLQISETWMRHYQVLEERTHPEMVMEGQSGYILTGTTIIKY